MSILLPRLIGPVIAATHNPGKIKELSALLAPCGLELESAGEHGIPEPEESGSSFAANAALKARHAAYLSGLPALADDSGLCVEALFGDPGIFSARWAGPERDFSLAMRRVKEALERCHGSNRAASFVCALALAWPDGEAHVFEGEVQGRLVFPGRGKKGFGYDPIFVADGFRESFGEMEPSSKHAISHRARAFTRLQESLP